MTSFNDAFIIKTCPVDKSISTGFQKNLTSAAPTSVTYYEGAILTVFSVHPQDSFGTAQSFSINTDPNTGMCE